MIAVIYLLGAVTSFICAFVLLRTFRKSGARLLLWSGLCFVGLTLDNAVLFVDVVVFPEVDLSLWRQLGTLTGLVLLIYGLVWEAD